MGYLYTGGEGTTLREIIDLLGYKDYPVIMCRCLWELNGEEQDDLFGYCKYENGKLEPLDGDIYSLDDQYIKWEVTVEAEAEDKPVLTVWEKGVWSKE